MPSRPNSNDDSQRPVKRGRGRPKGSYNRPIVVADNVLTHSRRGRPIAPEADPEVKLMSYVEQLSVESNAAADQASEQQEPPPVSTRPVRSTRSRHAQRVHPAPSGRSSRPSTKTRQQEAAKSQPPPAYEEPVVREIDSVAFDFPARGRYPPRVSPLYIKNDSIHARFTEPLRHSLHLNQNIIARFGSVPSMRPVFDIKTPPGKSTVLIDLRRKLYRRAAQILGFSQTVSSLILASHVYHSAILRVFSDVYCSARLQNRAKKSRQSSDMVEPSITEDVMQMAGLADPWKSIPSQPLPMQTAYQSRGAASRDALSGLPPAFSSLAMLQFASRFPFLSPVRLPHLFNRFDPAHWSATRVNHPNLYSFQTDYLLPAANGPTPKLSPLFSPHKSTLISHNLVTTMMENFLAMTEEYNYQQYSYGCLLFEYLMLAHIIDIDIIYHSLWSYFHNNHLDDFLQFLDQIYYRISTTIPLSVRSQLFPPWSKQMGAAFGVRISPYSFRSAEFDLLDEEGSKKEKPSTQDLQQESNESSSTLESTLELSKSSSPAPSADSHQGGAVKEEEQQQQNQNQSIPPNESVPETTAPVAAPKTPYEAGLAFAMDVGHLLVFCRDRCAQITEMMMTSPWLVSRLSMIENDMASGIEDPTSPLADTIQKVCEHLHMTAYPSSVPDSTEALVATSPLHLYTLLHQYIFGHLHLPAQITKMLNCAPPRDNCDGHQQLCRSKNLGPFSSSTLLHCLLTLPFYQPSAAEITEYIITSHNMDKVSSHGHLLNRFSGSHYRENPYLFYSLDDRRISPNQQQAQANFIHSDFARHRQASVAYLHSLLANTARAASRLLGPELSKQIQFSRWLNIRCMTGVLADSISPLVLQALEKASSTLLHHPRLEMLLKGTNGASSLSLFVTSMVNYFMTSTSSPTAVYERSFLTYLVQFCKQPGYDVSHLLSLFQHLVPPPAGPSVEVDIYGYNISTADNIDKITRALERICFNPVTEAIPMIDDIHCEVFAWEPTPAVSQECAMNDIFVRENEIEHLRFQRWLYTYANYTSKLFVDIVADPLHLQFPLPIYLPASERKQDGAAAVTDLKQPVEAVPGNLPLDSQSDPQNADTLRPQLSNLTPMIQSISKLPADSELFDIDAWLAGSRLYLQHNPPPYPFASRAGTGVGRIQQRRRKKRTSEEDSDSQDFPRYPISPYFAKLLEVENTRKQLQTLFIHHVHFQLHSAYKYYAQLLYDLIAMDTAVDRLQLDGNAAADYPIPPPGTDQSTGTTPAQTLEHTESAMSLQHTLRELISVYCPQLLDEITSTITSKRNTSGNDVENPSLYPNISYSTPPHSELASRLNRTMASQLTAKAFPMYYHPHQAIVLHQYKGLLSSYEAYVDYVNCYYGVDYAAHPHPGAALAFYDAAGQKEESSDSDEDDSQSQPEADKAPTTKSRHLYTSNHTISASVVPKLTTVSSRIISSTARSNPGELMDRFIVQSPSSQMTPLVQFVAQQMPTVIHNYRYQHHRIHWLKRSIWNDVGIEAPFDVFASNMKDLSGCLRKLADEHHHMKGRDGTPRFSPTQASTSKEATTASSESPAEGEPVTVDTSSPSNHAAYDPFAQDFFYTVATQTYLSNFAYQNNHLSGFERKYSNLRHAKRKLKIFHLTDIRDTQIRQDMQWETLDYLDRHKIASSYDPQLRAHAHVNEEPLPPLLSPLVDFQDCYKPRSILATVTEQLSNCSPSMMLLPQVNVSKSEPVPTRSADQVTSKSYDKNTIINGKNALVSLVLRDSLVKCWMLTLYTRLLSGFLGTVTNNGVKRANILLGHQRFLQEISKTTITLFTSPTMAVDLVNNSDFLISQYDPTIADPSQRISRFSYPLKQLLNDVRETWAKSPPAPPQTKPSPAEVTISPNQSFLQHQEEQLFPSINQHQGQSHSQPPIPPKANDTPDPVFAREMNLLQQHQLQSTLSLDCDMMMDHNDAMDDGDDEYTRQPAPGLPSSLDNFANLYSGAYKTKPHDAVSTATGRAPHAHPIIGSFVHNDNTTTSLPPTLVHDDIPDYDMDHDDGSRSALCSDEGPRFTESLAVTLINENGGSLHHVEQTPAADIFVQKDAIHFAMKSRSFSLLPGPLLSLEDVTRDATIGDHPSNKSLTSRQPQTGHRSAAVGHLTHKSTTRASFDQHPLVGHLEDFSSIGRVVITNQYRYIMNYYTNYYGLEHIDGASSIHPDHPASIEASHLHNQISGELFDRLFQALELSSPLSDELTSKYPLLSSPVLRKAIPMLIRELDHGLSKNPALNYLGHTDYRPSAIGCFSPLCPICTPPPSLSATFYYTSQYRQLVAGQDPASLPHFGVPFLGLDNSQVSPLTMVTAVGIHNYRQQCAPLYEAPSLNDNHQAYPPKTPAQHVWDSYAQLYGASDQTISSLFTKAPSSYEITLVRPPIQRNSMSTLPGTLVDCAYASAGREVIHDITCFKSKQQSPHDPYTMPEPSVLNKVLHLIPETIPGVVRDRIKQPRIFELFAELRSLLMECIDALQSAGCTITYEEQLYPLANDMVKFEESFPHHLAAVVQSQDEDSPINAGVTLDEVVSGLSVPSALSRLQLDHPESDPLITDPNSAAAAKPSPPLHFVQPLSQTTYGIHPLSMLNHPHIVENFKMPWDIHGVPISHPVAQSARVEMPIESLLLIAHREVVSHFGDIALHDCNTRHHPSPMNSADSKKSSSNKDTARAANSANAANAPFHYHHDDQIKCLFPSSESLESDDYRLLRQIYTTFIETSSFKAVKDSPAIAGNPDAKAEGVSPLTQAPSTVDDPNAPKHLPLSAICHTVLSSICGAIPVPKSQPVYVPGGQAQPDLASTPILSGNQDPASATAGGNDQVPSSSLLGGIFSLNYGHPEAKPQTQQDSTTTTTTTTTEVDNLSLGTPHTYADYSNAYYQYLHRDTAPDVYHCPNPWGYATLYAHPLLNSTAHWVDGVYKQPISHPLSMAMPLNAIPTEENLLQLRNRQRPHELMDSTQFIDKVKKTTLRSDHASQLRQQQKKRVRNDPRNTAAYLEASSTMKESDLKVEAPPSTSTQAEEEILSDHVQTRRHEPSVVAPPAARSAAKASHYPRHQNTLGLDYHAIIPPPQMPSYTPRASSVKSSFHPGLAMAPPLKNHAALSQSLSQSGNVGSIQPIFSQHTQPIGSLPPIFPRNAMMHPILPLTVHQPITQHHLNQSTLSQAPSVANTPSASFRLHPMHSFSSGSPIHPFMQSQHVPSAAEYFLQRNMTYAQNVLHTQDLGQQQAISKPNLSSFTPVLTPKTQVTTELTQPTADIPPTQDLK